MFSLLMSVLSLIFIFGMTESTHVFKPRMHNVIQTNNFDIKYDVSSGNSIYYVQDTDTLVTCDDFGILFYSSSSNLINDIAIKEGCEPSIINSMNMVNGTYLYKCNKISGLEFIENGTISIRKAANKEFPFCIGFNADGKCSSPATIIPIFQNEFMNVKCDNCFIGFAGDIVIDIEIGLFKIKKIEFGFDKMYLRGGLGVDMKAQKDLAYSYDKIFPVLSGFKLVSFNVGPIPVSIMVDFPIEVKLDASISATADIDVGSNLNINIGTLAVVYENGHTRHIIPKPVTTHTSYIHTEAYTSGKVHFEVVPELSIYANPLFKFDIKFDPQTKLEVYGATTLKSVCVTGTYDVVGTIGGKVLGDTIPTKTIYDSGEKTFVQQCVKV